MCLNKYIDRGIMKPDDLINLIVTLTYASIAGGLVFVAFRYYYRGLPINSELDISLIPASVLSAFLFTQFTIWPGLSILLVVIFGAIHFRTVIKEPADAVFVFWSIISGIMTGSGYRFSTILFNLAILLGGVIVLMIRQDLGSYLLIISYHPSVETKLMDKISPLQATVQEMSEANSRRDMTLKLSAKNIDLELIDQLSEMDGVYQALIMHSNY